MRFIWTIISALLIACPLSAQVSKTTNQAVYQLQQFKITPVELDHSFSVSIALPPSYNTSPEQHFPVLYVLDGHLTFTLTEGLTKWLFRESGERALEEFVIVGIDYEFDPDMNWQQMDRHWFLSRYHDMTPTETYSERHTMMIKGLAPKFLSFLTKELAPEIEKRFRIKTNDRALAGYSLGGLFAAYAMLTEPQYFNRYLIGDPALWYGADDGLDNYAILDHLKAYNSHNKNLNARVYISSNGQSGPAMVNSINKFISAIEAASFPSMELKIDRFPDENHYTGVPLAFSNGLQHLFRIVRDD